MTGAIACVGCGAPSIPGDIRCVDCDDVVSGLGLLPSTGWPLLPQRVLRHAQRLAMRSAANGSQSWCLFDDVTEALAEQRRLLARLEGTRLAELLQ
jgi:hypothetical protein